MERSAKLLEATGTREFDLATWWLPARDITAGVSNAKGGDDNAGFDSDDTGVEDGEARVTDN